MKITVRITGVLEAELELPETTASALGARDFGTWHSNQYVHAMEFVDRCAKRATEVVRAQKPTEP